MFSRESLAKVGSQDHLLGFPRRFRGPSTWECNSSNKEYVIGVFCILKYNLLLIFIYLHFIILEMYPDTMSSWTYKYNAFKFKKLNKKYFFWFILLEGERGMQGPSVCWIGPQMVTMDKAWSIQIWESGASSVLPTWIQRPKHEG